MRLVLGSPFGPRAYMEGGEEEFHADPAPRRRRTRQTVDPSTSKKKPQVEKKKGEEER